MLGSLVRILLLIAAVIGLTYGAQYLLGTQGGVQVTVAGTEYSFQPLDAAIGLALLVAAIWVFLKLLSLLVAVLKFLSGDETALSRWQGRSRERRGYRALSEGMMALAAGEGRQAITKAAQAERYLQKPELTRLLVAQAAEITGDRDKATATYKEMIRDEKTRFVGVRGILKQKLLAGETDTAKQLAEEAFRLRPRNEEIQDTLLKLQADAHDWAGARQTLAAKLKHGSLPRDVYYRREAVLALSEAQDVLDPDASIEDREQAIEANRKSPDLIPAAAMAARSLISKGKNRAAARILRKAWESQPHPDLASAFAEIAPDETPDQRVKRFENLFSANPDNLDTKLIKAELLVAAEDFPAAGRIVTELVNDDADARVMTLMAAIERGKGADEAVVRGWLAKAVTAKRGPQWVCSVCGKVHDRWTPICDNCGGFDTLVWTTPPENDATAATGAQMLPLILGAGASDTSAEAETSPAAEATPTPAETVAEAETVEGEAEDAKFAPAKE